MSQKIFASLLVGVIFLSGCMHDTRVVAPQNPPPPVTNNPVTTNSQMLGTNTDVKVKSGEITYANGEKGFLAEPEEAGDYPGVVVIHEWWGLNQQIKDTAVQLAQNGYRVLAVDLYQGVVATTSSEAQKLRSNLKPEDALKDMQGAVAYLKQSGSDKIASLGWCFGGGQSLNLAMSGEKLDATVIYYGTLATTTQALSKVSAPVLGIFGDKDTSIPVEQVKQFDAALDDKGVENSIHIYPGVGHAFANPSGANYAPNETKDAWDKTINFLKEHLDPPAVE